MKMGAKWTSQIRSTGRGRERGFTRRLAGWRVCGPGGLCARRPAVVVVVVVDVWLGSGKARFDFVFDP